MKKLFFSFGTRPELIKLAPVIDEAKKNKLPVVVCCSDQHTDMLTPFLDFFKIKIDYSLNIQRKTGDLAELTALILNGLSPILKLEKPDYVIVQGDTTTTFASALAAFYEKINVVHVEAGLRTYNPYSPFPEEMNRCITSQITAIHFPPTHIAHTTLQQEKVRGLIKTTGNTAIDAVKIAYEKLQADPHIFATLKKHYSHIHWNHKIILVTCHRRENIGVPLENICNSLIHIIQDYSDIDIVLPMHLNPSVRNIIQEKLSKHPNIHLLPPLSYKDFIFMMSQAYLIVTDSGGVQEEAPYFKVPVLVIRNETERVEGLHAGTSRLIGTTIESVYTGIKLLLSDPTIYNKMRDAENPYGDGHAAERIITTLMQ